MIIGRSALRLWLWRIMFVALAFVAVWGMGKAVAQSLEVPLVQQSEYGPVLTEDSGCFIYGELWAALVEAHAHGAPKQDYAAMVRTSKLQPVPGMVAFLLQMLDAVWAQPPHALPLDAKKVAREGREFCRERGGATWLFWPLREL